MPDRHPWAGRVVMVKPLGRSHVLATGAATLRGRFADETGTPWAVTDDGAYATAPMKVSLRLVIDYVERLRGLGFKADEAPLVVSQHGYAGLIREDELVGVLDGPEAGLCRLPEGLLTIGGDGVAR